MKVNDKKIVNYIKYLPFYFLIITTIVFGIYIIISNHYNETNEKKLLRINLEKEYKEKIKQETSKVVDYINRLKSLKEEETIKLLKEKSDTAYYIVDSIYKANKDKSKDEIISLIKDALQDIRYFDGRGYYYIIDYKTGFCYFHPIFKQLENISLMNHQDANGMYLTKEMIKVIENKDEGHINYFWYKKDDKINQYEKIAYLRKFEPLGFYFVISDYTDSINKVLKEEIKNFLHSVNFKDESHYFIINKATQKFEFHEFKDMIDKPVSNKNYILETQKVLSIFNNKPEGFHTYKIRLDDSSVIDKISYIHTIPEWDWIVGIGYYEKNILKIIDEREKVLEKFHRKNLISTLIFMFVVSLAVLLISRYFSSIIERRFKIYNFSINRKIVEIGRQQRVLAQQTKMAAMGEMIENIAHQWRQPLSIISTCSTGLKVNKEYGTLDDETFYSSVKSINDSAQYLSETIDDFRNFYQKSNEEKTFRLDEMIEKALQLLKTKTDSMHIEIYKDIKKITYKGYENELLQVILNLLKNSIDQFLDIKDDNYKYHLKIEVYKNRDNIFLEFTDNGGGISSEILDRIFEPYFTTKNKNIGTGIGLYMSKNIVEKHFDGNMEAKNIIANFDNTNYKCAKFTIRIKENKN